MGGEVLRILLVEDDEDDYLLFSALLNSIHPSRYEIDWVKDYESALAGLLKCDHDVSILDYSLGEHNGLELLNQACKNGCRIPIIFLTSHGDYRIDFDAMKGGAADYLLKDELNAPLLERSIRYAIERRQSQEALRRSEERFRFLAENTRDALYRLRYDSMLYDYLSPAIEILTGYSREELEEIGFASLVTRIDLPGRDDVSPAEIIKDRHNGNSCEFQAEYLIKNRDGETRWLRDRSSPWRGVDGEILGSVGILSDITENKLAEEALRCSEKQLRLLSTKLLTVQEEERTRLAQGLHDRIGQTLVAIKVNIERALGSESVIRQTARCAFLEPLVPMIQKALDEVRNIYMDLRPTVLDDLGIVAAVHYLCREFERSYPRIHVVRTIDAKSTDIPPAIGIVIYRILQEAFNNAAEHAKPSMVCVSLAKKEENIELVVSDNGIGFDVKQALVSESRISGLGLAATRERTVLSGGNLAIESHLGMGTTIRAWWLLQTPAVNPCRAGC
jgi:two-component system sensor histidine kinase UhpB